MTKKNTPPKKDKLGSVKKLETDIPVRCTTCGNVIRRKVIFELVETMPAPELSKDKSFNELTNLCCRKHLF